MSKDSYRQIATDEFMLRDRLAIDRTILANERTLLAYARTALALLVIGLTCLHFIDDGVLHLLAIGFIGVGGVVFFVGVVQFLRVKRRLDAIQQP